MKNIIIIFLLLTTLYGQENNSTMLLGTNALYWVENDKLRSEPNYIENLKKLDIQTMRFPGGEVADNYDWRTNSLNDPKRWPFSIKASDSIDRMDFNEFIRLQKKLGSEPIIVVNLENGFVTGNLEEAANIAAQWVRYANVEMGYSVKYWEIGNESYLMQTRCPLSAEEYAKAFNYFAKKMKAVDPTIKLGAIGPFNVAHSSLYDKLTTDNKQKVRKVKNGKKRKKMAKKLLLKQKQVKKVRWWDVVLGVSSENVDFIALHHYINVRKKDGDMKKPLGIKHKIEQMSTFMKKKIDIELPIFLTEWNVFKKHSLSNANYILTIEEAEKEFSLSGVNAICFWPLRNIGKKNKMFSMKKLHILRKVEN